MRTIKKTRKARKKVAEEGVSVATPEGDPKGSAPVLATLT